MRSVFKSLIMLVLVCAAEAQVWPGGALCGSETGLPCSPAGHITFKLAGAMLQSDHWRDARSRFSFDIGLGRGLGMSVSGSTRHLKGYGAFEKGFEDTRLGMSFWPSFSSKIAAGINGHFIVPTGYRRPEFYYDAAADTSLVLPAMSLKQTAGEICGGAVWTIGPAAEVNVFGGYFGTSDRAEQAFRWGLGTRLSPFGESCWAELNYTQSNTRTGALPSTETFEAALPFRAGWGVTLVPGLWADLDSEPLYGASLGLRFSAHVPGIAPLQALHVTAAPPRIAGVALVAPPLSDMLLADGKELWQSIQDGVRASFDDVKPLVSLDLPGLPFNDGSEEPLHSSIRALAQAHPDADWLLISRVIREDISRQSGGSVPLMVTRATWAAQCKLKVQLVDLRGERIRCAQIIEGRALKKDFPQLALMSPSDDEVLSMNASRQLTFEAYRSAGREIARELVRSK